tara:strand:- start:117080 stop:118240 length:1161 start_codon:yes stop_codon:yes gene_type:complete
MKARIVLIVMLCSTFFSYAQEKPQPVNSLTKEFKEFEWYTEQYSLWENEIEKDSKNEAAWINLYAAARYAKYTAKDEESKKVWSKKENDVLPKMSKAIEGTYAYYRIFTWHNSIWDAKDKDEQDKIINYALKAYKLDPSNPDIYPNLMNIYEIYKPDQTKQKELAQQWKKSGDFTPNLMALSYNALMNTKKNAILITAGDNDTYPLWVAQHADQFRKDVNILNIFLITLPDYRNRMFKSLNIPQLEGDDLKHSEIIEHIIKYKGDHLLYFYNKGSIAKDSTLHDNLYNVGLVYQYAEESFDNSALIVDHFENRFLLDHVKYSFYQSTYPKLDQRHNYSYLPGLMSLYQHYVLIENESKTKETKELILRLGEGFPYLQEIKEELGLD